MDVRMTSEMLDALRATPEVPDNVMARIDDARADGDNFIVELDDVEAMAMVEMCLWYIHKDPDTGELPPKARLFNAMVDAIDEAEMSR